jgi:hypothetical protein
LAANARGRARLGRCGAQNNGPTGCSVVCADPTDSSREALRLAGQRRDAREDRRLDLIARTKRGGAAQSKHGGQTGEIAVVHQALCGNREW